MIFGGVLLGLQLGADIVNLFGYTSLIQFLLILLFVCGALLIYFADSKLKKSKNN